MKKIVSILMFLLCVASASAVTYGNPYRGAGRNGYVATGYRSTSTGLSQAPTASMRSTSSVGYSTAYAGTMKTASGVTTMQVQGMYTAASAVRGGVTTYDAGAGIGPRRSASTPPPSPGDQGYCDGCHYVWDDDANAGDGGWVCDRCGCELEEGCHCGEDPYGPGYCWCPIGDGWDVWIMLAVMAVGYAWFVRRRRVKSIVKP